MWTCPKCGTKVDPSFEVCWSCGTTPDGVEDPNFVKADDVGAIHDAPPEEKIPDEELERGGPAPETPPEEELVECYWARNVQEARFLADQLIDLGIPAASDEQNLRFYLAGLPLGPYFGPRVWVRAKDKERAHAWLEEYDRDHKAHFHPGIAD
jgi:hypothetical protein